MKRVLSFFSLFTLLLSIPFPLYAQKEDVTLEEVVVTATRDVEEIRKVPANVTVITKEEIEQSNARTTVDLVRDEVGVVVRDYYGTGKSASVDIRGFGETAPSNVLVLVDGRRVNEIDLSGVDWTQIPLDQIERIEIVRGAGSVLYGDNAVGGVINIITKKPDKPFSAQAEGVVGSYQSSRLAGSVGGKWGSFSAMINADYSTTDGYRDNGFLRAKNLGGRFIYDVSEALSLSFSGNLHRDDAGYPGGLPKPLYEQDRESTLHPDDRAKTDDGYSLLGVKAKLWDVGRIEADFSYRHREIDDSFPSFFFEDERRLTTWGLTPRYILEKPLVNHSNKLTVGVDLYQSDSNVDSQSVFFGANRLVVKKKSAGVYALDELSVLENLILSLGYRHEWVHYDLLQGTPQSEDKTKDHEPAYSLSLDYLFWKKSSVFISAKRSFRFPVSDELIQFYPTFQVNPSIQPQTGYHYEAGVRHAFSDHIEANLTFFWIDQKDEIFFNPATFSNENYPKTRRQGLEAGVNVRPLPWFSVWGNYSFIKPILRAGSFSGNDIPGVPRNKASAGTNIDMGKGFLFDARVTYVGPRYLISDFGNKLDRMDGYSTFDTKLTYSWKGLKTFVGINNLFNEKYAEWAVTNAAGTTQLFYAAPERNFFGGISYSF
ncbi:MAG: TonB-dependent receptor [Deltaproteobacteria bacterium]